MSKPVCSQGLEVGSLPFSLAPLTFSRLTSPIDHFFLQSIISVCPLPIVSPLTRTLVTSIHSLIECFASLCPSWPHRFKFPQWQIHAKDPSKNLCSLYDEDQWPPRSGPASCPSLLPACTILSAKGSYSFPISFSAFIFPVQNSHHSPVHLVPPAYATFSLTTQTGITFSLWTFM